MPASVRAAVESAYDVHLGNIIASLVGEESIGWRTHSDRGDVAIQLLPPWRTEDETTWVHAVLRAIALHVPQAVAPHVSTAGRSVLEVNGRVVTVFPFIEGEPLDDKNQRLRVEGARVLARIHSVGRTLQAPPRPSAGDGAPSRRRGESDHPSMVDPELDAWERQLENEPLVRGIIHGDFYPRNVLCRDAAIAGVIDWMEMDHAPLVTELGWVIWEFSHNDDGDALHLARAMAFLDAYREAGGPVAPAEDEHLVPAIRRRLRAEVRASFAMSAAAGGDAGDDDYREAEDRAFSRLRGVRFP